MTWNFHSFYTNTETGLIGKLKLTDQENEALKALRKKVRTRTRDIFEEAKQLVKLTKNDFSLESLRKEISGTSFKHLSLQDQAIFADLIAELDQSVKAEFLKLSPRFWTQGSFVYDTLNKPYKTPPQEMDIDDGTYLPMVFFDDTPVIGHQLLLLLVDTSLKSLVVENDGWFFEAKRTCGRIKIPAMNVHIDVPMYAIPQDKFLEKEQILKEAANTRFHFEAYDSVSVEDHALYQLDSDCVNLAVRADDQKWMKSDPKDVHLWFVDSSQRIGQHLKKICRFLKAWRDAQWVEGGGPTSISLMAATVSILDNTAVDPKDFGATMLTIAKALPQTFKNGIESPDESDERPLFPHYHKHGEKEREIIKKLEHFAVSLEDAIYANTKQDALNILNLRFGERVKNTDLIVSQKAAPAFEIEPTKAKQTVIISSTMKSG